MRIWKKNVRCQKMEGFKIILLVFLVICAVAASLIRNPLLSVIVFMSYSLIMSIIWFLLESCYYGSGGWSGSQQYSVLCYTAKAQSAFGRRRS